MTHHETSLLSRALDRVACALNGHVWKWTAIHGVRRCDACGTTKEHDQ